MIALSHLVIVLLGAELGQGTLSVFVCFTVFVSRWVLLCILILRCVLVDERLVFLRVRVVLKQALTLVFGERLEVFGHQEYIEFLLILAQHLQLVSGHYRLENVIDERIVERVLRQKLPVCRAWMVHARCLLLMLDQVELDFLAFAQCKRCLMLNEVA